MRPQIQGYLNRAPLVDVLILVRVDPISVGSINEHAQTLILRATSNG